MDRLKYNPLTGEFQMMPDSNTYTFRINERTFEVPIGMTWIEWWAQLEESQKARFAPLAEINTFVNDLEAPVMPITPMHFYREYPTHSLVQLDRYPVGGMQYVMPYVISLKEYNIIVSGFNLGACYQEQPGASFFNSRTETAERTGVVENLHFRPGDFRSDAATAWFSRNFYSIEIDGPIWSTPTTEQWRLLNNFRFSLTEAGVFFYTIGLFLPYGFYMVADAPSSAVVIDSGLRGISPIPVSPDVPKLVRPFLAI